MKRATSILVICLILLMVTPLFAQSPRQPTSSEGKSTFTNIAATGLNVTGVPGYIELVNGDGDSFYLYVDTWGGLRIASAQACGFGASPQTVSWTRGSSRGEAGVLIGYAGVETQ